MKLARHPSKVLVLVFALALCVAAQARADEWRALFYHTHTTYSTDNSNWEAFKPSVGQVIAAADWVAQQMGVEAAVTITDHRSISSSLDPEFVPIGVTVPIKGEEWSGDGHAGALGFTGETTISPYSGPEQHSLMTAEVHSRGGIAIANHPAGGSWKSDRRCGIDGIEVWSVSFWDFTDEEATAWWQRLLAAGERLTAIGGSDRHFAFLPIDRPTNLVWSKSNSEADMLDAVRQGRVIILRNSTAPRVVLGADADGDGAYDDATVGDVVILSSPKTVEFEVRVTGAAGTDHLELIDEGGAFYCEKVGSGPGWDGQTYRFSRAADETSRGFVRAELRDSGRIPHCLTNPIYLLGRLAPSETEGNITGTITDIGGALLEGVTIIATPGENSVTVTAVDGRYTLTVPNGNYTITASKEGYGSEVAPGVAVGPGAGVVIDFELSLGSGGGAASDP